MSRPRPAAGSPLQESLPRAQLQRAGINREGLSIARVLTERSVPADTQAKAQAFPWVAKASVA